ncbi:MAG: hypothetical protein ACT4OX_03600 [Actinomycetota bacterium]
MDPREPYDLYAPTRETGPKNFYRLAGSASGTGGSGGSPNLGSPESLEEFARQYRERAERALALEEATAEYEDARYRAEVVCRRIERKQAARVRRRERIGAEDRHRANRPVKVDVDPHAWEVVKREAIRRRLTVGQAVGELVCRSAHSGIRPRRSPARNVVRRFARLVVDDGAWAEFRVLALDARVSTGRCVGLLVELEARRIERSGR